jgi:hypothetical protein
VQEAEKLSLEEIRRLLEASEGIRFVGVKRALVDDWIELVLCEYLSSDNAAIGICRHRVSASRAPRAGPCSRTLTSCCEVHFVIYTIIW